MNSKYSNSPPYLETIHGSYSEEYIQGMKTEVSRLVLQNVWNHIPRCKVNLKHTVLKRTWVFKLKRLLDGSPLKYKVRFCVRGNMRTEGADYFDTYTLVVQGSTVKTLLTLV